MLARHYTEAGLFEQGAKYWRKAGRNAQDRWALKEAIAHLEKGLDAIGTAAGLERAGWIGAGVPGRTEHGLGSLQGLADTGA